METREYVLQRVTDHYLATEEFNGLPASQLLAELGDAECAAAIEHLVHEWLISLNFGNYHPNPRIKAFPARSPDEQIATMRELGLGAACVYPERAYLERVVDRDQYQGRPYTLALALGDAELSHRAFDLAALERYRNDPRYLYQNDDVSGMISIHDEFFGPGKAPERDQISLQTFGFCFDDDSNCCVAVFNRYLANLSPEHQQYWSGFEIETPSRLHPEYFRPSILGEFPENISVYAAVLREMQAINDLAGGIRRPRFFREDFRNHDEPPYFGRLVRPTAHEFGQFVHALDRMFSDNINVDFFGEDVPRERDIERSDGRIEVQRKGSIQILSDWLEAKFRPKDAESRQMIAEMLKTLREIRTLRMRPAHALDNNAFTQEFTRKQRDLIVKVYRAVKAVRLILSCHFGAGSVEIDPYIRDGNVCSM